MLIFLIAWNVVVATLFIVDPHPSFDMKRCYVDRAAFTRICWPKHGCFFTDADGHVLCWAVEKPRRGVR